MKRTLMLLGMATLTLVLLFGCEKSKQTTGTDGTNGEPIPDALALARTLHPILANGSDTLTVHATVVDSKGRGIGNVGVSFGATHGTIPQHGTTDANGIARATLTAAASTVDLVSTVSVDVVTAKTAAPLDSGAMLIVTGTPLSPELIARVMDERKRVMSAAASTQAKATLHDEGTVLMRGVTLLLDASPRAIPADGISSSRILARLIETTRRVPLEGQEVRFGATAGSVTGSVTSDVAGEARGTLTGTAADTASDVTAYYGPELSSTVHVRFRPLELLVESMSPALLADGSSRTSIVARLLVQGEGTPVVGARIDFSTNLGTVNSPVMTDSRGEAEATLVAASTTGTAHVAARFGVSLAGSVDVQFLAPPTTSDMVLQTDPVRLPADGASEAILTARALTSTGSPMPDGTIVTFDVLSGDGKIVGPIQLTRGGLAEAVFVAGTTVGPVMVRASSGTAQVTASIDLDELDASELALAVDSSRILANGIAEAVITATVTDRFGHAVRPGTNVAFTTSLGSLSHVTPTDASGVATARIRSVPFVTGTGRVTAEVGEARETVDLIFVSETAAHVEVVRVDYPRIGVRGAGDHETSTILFEVQDRNGVPVDLEHAVTLSFRIVPVTGETDATIHPASGRTNAKGQVGATVNAGYVSGVVEVSASDGSILSQPIRVAIHGDLPDLAHFGIFFERINIEGLCYAGVLNHVTAKVADEHGNCVPESTAVWFEAEYGVVQGSAYTNDLCDAVVFEETGPPFPALPGGDGLVRICAQTVGKSGDLISTCGYVMWSGPTIVEIVDPADGFEVPNGGSIVITYRVHDANDNPLTGGTTIKVTTTTGLLGGTTEIELPDTQSSAYTTFRVVLADADPTTSEAATATVTVSVKGKNGPGSTFISGTVF